MLWKGCENVANGGHSQYCNWLSLVTFSQTFLSDSQLLIARFNVYINFKTILFDLKQNQTCLSKSSNFKTMFKQFRQLQTNQRRPIWVRSDISGLKFAHKKVIKNVDVPSFFFCHVISLSKFLFLLMLFVTACSVNSILERNGFLAWRILLFTRQ